MAQEKSSSRSASRRFDYIRALVNSQTTLALATTDQNLTPRSTPLFYVADEGLRLYWFSSRRSLHSRNCERNPAASAAIFRDARGWRQIEGAQFEGAASVVADRNLRKAILRQYVERFELGKLFSAALRGSALYCFTPSWVRYTDNSRRFGYKFELKLPPVGSVLNG